MENRQGARLRHGFRNEKRYVHTAKSYSKINKCKPHFYKRVVGGGVGVMTPMTSPPPSPDQHSRAVLVKRYSLEHTVDV